MAVEEEAARTPETMAGALKKYFKVRSWTRPRPLKEWVHLAEMYPPGERLFDSGA